MPKIMLREEVLCSTNLGYIILMPFSIPQPKTLHKPETKHFIALINTSHGGPTTGKPQQPDIMMQGGGGSVL